MIHGFEERLPNWSHRLIWGAVTLGSLAVLLLWWRPGWIGLQPSYRQQIEQVRIDPTRIRAYRPGTVDLSWVEGMELKLNGRPLFSNPHAVQPSDCLVTGKFRANVPNDPPKSWSLDLAFNLRPANAPDGDWMILPEEARAQFAWRVDAGGDHDEVLSTVPRLERHFKPGEYRLDIYFEANDMTEGKSRVFLLGTVPFQLLPETRSLPPVKVVRRP